MPQYPGFLGGSYTSLSSLANGEQTWNFYLERMETQASTAKLALYPTPGVQTFATATGAPGRGSFRLVHDGVEKAFCVIGSTFYEVSNNGTLTNRGTVAIDANPATFAYNGDGGGQLIVSSGDRGYVWDLDASTFTQVRASATTMVEHLDGYFLALDVATSTVFRSALLDGTSWDGTEFHQRSIASDPWIAIKVLDRYLWHLGTDTSEVWYNQGSLNDPFAPHPSGLVPFGCAAGFSPHVVAGSLMWLAKTAEGSGNVVKAAGFSPEVVSTFALHAAIDDYEIVSDAIGDTYEDLGHTFYILTFPRANKTVAYDATPTLGLGNAMRWTDRGTWISEENRYDAWRPLFHMYAFGKHLMLDRDGSDIFQLSSEFGSDVESRPLRRLRRPPAIFRENRRIFVPEFEVFVEPGLGLVSGQGSDPQMMLRTSRDGGKTWSNERSRSAGELGDYTRRLIWTRCGSARRWMPEIVVTDPVPWHVLGARYREAA